MKRKVLLFAILCFVLMLSLASVAQAQTGLVYGDRVFGEITGTQPQVFYTFAATAGDWVTARVVGTSPGMMPSIGLNAPTGQQVSFNSSDSFGITGRSARISYRVEQTGVYTIQIGALPDAQGGFLLILDGQPAITVATLSDVATTTEVFANSPQSFFVNASPTASVSVNVAGAGNYVVKVIDTMGDYIAIVRSDVLAISPINLPAGEGQYTVIIESSEDVTVTLNIGAPATTTDPNNTVADPVATEDVSAPPPAGICTVTSTGAVNVRSGDGTSFNAFATLTAGNYYEVTGRTPSNWYRIDVNGQHGYVFADVVILNGPCDNIASVPSVDGGQSTTQATATPVPTTDGNTPTEEPTEEPTDDGQQAPSDSATFNWDVDRDTGGQFSEVVSYPNGDTVDQISAVMNLNNSNNYRETTYTFVCNGTGTENVRFGFGSQNSPNQYSCGESAVRIQTNEGTYRQFIVVYFVDGSSSSYVNYTIIATPQQ